MQYHQVDPVLTLILSRLQLGHWFPLGHLSKALSVSGKPPVDVPRWVKDKKNWEGWNNYGLKVERCGANGRCMLLLGPGNFEKWTSVPQSGPDSAVVPSLEQVKSLCAATDAARTRARRYLDLHGPTARPAPAPALPPRPPRVSTGAAAPRPSESGGASAAPGSFRLSRARGEPFDSAHRKRVATDGRSREDLLRELEKERRDLNHSASLLEAAEIRAARIGAQRDALIVERDAQATRAAVGEALFGQVAAASVMTEREELEATRSRLAASERQVAQLRTALQAQALKVVDANDARMKAEREAYEGSVEKGTAQAALSRALQREEKYSGMLGPAVHSATTAAAWTASTAKRARNRLKLYLEFHFGGISGARHEIARRSTSSSTAIAQLYKFKRFNETLSRALQREAVRAGKGDAAADRSCIAKLRVGTGLERMQRQNEELYDDHEIEVLGAKLCKVKIALTRHRHTAARARLVRRYWNDPSDADNEDDAPQPTKSPIAAFAPKIEMVTRESDGVPIGAVADTFAAHVLCAKTSLESEALQPRFDPCFDPELSARDGHHVRIHTEGARDLFPLNHQRGVTQCSVSCGNIGTAAGSPVNQFQEAFVGAKEDSPEMMKIYDAMQSAFDRLAASSPASSDGIPIYITPPSNAAWCPPEQRGIPREWRVHFTFGWMEHDDHKMMSLLWRMAGGNASCAVAGGVRYNVTKATRCDKWSATARIVEGSDPNRRPHDYVWTSNEWIADKCAMNKEEMARVRSENPTISDVAVRKHMNKFCGENLNAFTEGLPPFRFALLAFYDPLHLDNNLCQYNMWQYNDLAEEVAEKYKSVYQTDATSALRKLHGELRASGRRLTRVADSLTKLANKDKDGGQFRFTGDQTIDFFLSPWRWDGAVFVPEADDPTGYWWFKRTAIAARVRLHRCLSYMQVKHTIAESSIGDMIRLGELYQRVCFHGALPVTYGDSYLSKGNPYLLQRLAPQLRIAKADGTYSGFIMGIGRKSSTQVRADIRGARRAGS